MLKIVAYHIKSTQMSYGEGEGLRNGFVELHRLDKHNLSILGLRSLLWSADPSNESSRTRKLILSWDEKNIILWEHGKYLRQLKLGSFEGRGISAIAFISTLRVFVAATLSMTFIFYDHNLKMLETVSHDERMVTDIEFDSKMGQLVMSGSGGKRPLTQILHHTNYMIHIRKVFLCGK